jgi:response regulator RpfG family c-di-GMP phosphodiesterase
MTSRILCVDDEPNVLQALERQLRKQFEIVTAPGPVQGLEALERSGPFAVILSDLRMPVMNGIQFLATVKERSPESVRMMLSGQADFAATIEAVNEGSIFRFLTKPCENEHLVKALTAALEQYRLVQAERELLEHTLIGSIEVLSEILSLVSPSAFSRSHRIRRYVRHMADELGLQGTWQYEVAAMLSQIGCVTVSPDVLEKVYSGAPLSNLEAETFASHYQLGGRLLARIPRLDQVAQIIGCQQNLDWESAVKPESAGTVAIGAQMLQIANEFDQGIIRGVGRDAVIAEIRTRHPNNRDLISTLHTAQVPAIGTEVRMVGVHDLSTHMVINCEVYSKNGLLLLSKGQEVTDSVVARMLSFADSVGVVQPFSVVIPRTSAQDECASMTPLRFTVSTSKNTVVAVHDGGDV